MVSTLTKLPAKPRKLASRDGQYSCWLYRNVAINLWLAEPTLTGVAAITALTAERQSECPEGVASVHWLVPGVTLPSAKVRAALSDVLVRFPGHVTSVSVVFETEGFFASAMRSAVTGIGLLSPKSIPMRVFGSLHDFARWLPDIHVRATGVQLTSSELTDAFHEVLAPKGA